jgi:hypothetical protein
MGVDREEQAGIAATVAERFEDADGVTNSWR